MTGPIEGSLVGLSFDDDCFDDSAIDLANHHFSEQTFGQIDHFLSEVHAVELVLILDIFGSEVGAEFGKESFGFFS